MDRYAHPGPSVSLRARTPTDAVDALFLGPFLAGDQPVAVSRHLDHVKDGAQLIPPAAVLVRHVRTEHSWIVLSAGEGWSLVAERWKQGQASLTATAASEELATEVLDAACADAVEPPPDDDAVVEVGFWSMGGRGPVRRAVRIEVRPWPDIRRNYTAGVTTAVEQLMAVTPDAVQGRLLLLHGPPGTGKTTALRALAHGWRRWCDLEYVLDPERLLANPGYLVEASSGVGDDDRWCLLVLEDCDELIRADAKSGAGQSLARLLNLTDGILGQGLKVLVAITTNEPLARLHPAIVRPGRCLAQVEVGPLTPAEARRWLGEAVLVAAEGLTLAELYARLEGRAPIEVADDLGRAAGYL
jgi:hypothetical protein